MTPPLQSRPNCRTKIGVLNFAASRGRMKVSAFGFAASRFPKETSEDMTREDLILATAPHIDPNSPGRERRTLGARKPPVRALQKGARHSRRAPSLGRLPPWDGITTVGRFACWTMCPNSHNGGQSVAKSWLFYP
jgi:hypothetical protein